MFQTLVKHRQAPKREKLLFLAQFQEEHRPHSFQSPRFNQYQQT